MGATSVGLQGPLALVGVSLGVSQGVEKGRIKFCNCLGITSTFSGAIGPLDRFFFFFGFALNLEGNERAINLVWKGVRFRILSTYVGDSGSQEAIKISFQTQICPWNQELKT